MIRIALRYSEFCLLDSVDDWSEAGWLLILAAELFIENVGNSRKGITVQQKN